MVFFWLGQVSVINFETWSQLSTLELEILIEIVNFYY